MKNSKGFTLVELVVVIAILGILAGIAIPRFLEATAAARGAKIVADMRTIESAAYVYYAKNGKYPTDGSSEIKTMLQGEAMPNPPEGKFIITTSKGTVREGTVTGSGTTVKYEYKYSAGTSSAAEDFLVKLTGATFSKNGPTGENITVADLVND